MTKSALQIARAAYQPKLPKALKGDPWVKNISRPFTAGKGLEGRHIALWQSHGKYYKKDKGCWEWQRPRLFCTTEDLFTQSFVIPYIIPMLENAGDTGVQFTAIIIGGIDTQRAY